MPKESNLEFKVGIFIFLALILLAVFIFSVNDASVFKEGKSLRVIFGFANGLKKSAPVRVAGVDQGMVRDIHLFYDHEENRIKVEAEMWMKKDVIIPQDSVVFINQLGLMGEKYVEITPGKDAKNFFKDNELCRGKDPIAQEAISERILEMTKKLDQTVAGLNKILQDEDNIVSIHDTLENLSFLTGNLNHIAEDVKRGQGTVGKLLYDDNLYKNLQELSSDLKENPWKLLYRPKKDKKY